MIHAFRFASVCKLLICRDLIFFQMESRCFPGLVISNAKILIYFFSNKRYGNNFIKQHSELLSSEITKTLIAV